MTNSAQNPKQTTKASSNPTKPPATVSRGIAYDRELPHALEAERALLGAMLLEDAAISEAITALKDTGLNLFWLDKHQQLYEHIVRLWQENKPLDGVVIKDELVRRGAFESLGGYEFLTSLVSSVPSALRVNEYAQIVREKAILRQLIGATHRAMEVAFDDNLPTSEVLDFAEREIFGVTEKRVTGGPQPLPELVDEFFHKIDELDGRPLTGEPTGFFELDDLTCGLQPTELIIVAGRPSMGKTALGLNIAEHIALDQNPPRPVLFFSLEMSRQQVAQRILCSRARVDSQRLRRGRHSEQELRKLQGAADECQRKPLLVDDTSSLSILELRARARMAYRKHQIRAVFVDYLQLVRAPGAESRQQEVAEISRGLKALAKELNLPVIAMAQLNRKPEDRSSNRPRMSDLRESGALEQDADLVALLHRESYYKLGENQAAEGDPEAELIIAKQRNGPVGTVKLHFNRQWTRFDNPQYGDRFEHTYEAQPAGSLDFP
jgi:replicative DNA helicase